MSSTTPETGALRTPGLVAVSVVAALFVAGVLLLSGYDPPSADIKYDWLATREALRVGGDAHGDLLQLAAQEGVAVQINAPIGAERITGHPRTPGALLLLAPVAFVPYDVLFALAAGVTALSVAAMVGLTLRRRSRTLIGYFALLLLLTPAAMAIRFAGQAGLVAVLALSGWAMASRRDSVWAGVLIGLAATLKLFPLILVVPLYLAAKKLSGHGALATFVLLNLAGLFLPGITFARAMDELMLATGTWLELVANGSVVRQLVGFGLSTTAAAVIAIGVAVAVGFVYRRRFQTQPFFWLILSLLVLPLSWVSYDIVLYPVVLQMLHSSDDRLRLLGWLSVGLWLIPVAAYPFAVVSIGAFGLAVRLLLLGALLWKADEFSDGATSKPLHSTSPSLASATRVYGGSG